MLLLWFFWHGGGGLLVGENSRRCWKFRSKARLGPSVSQSPPATGLGALACGKMPHLGGTQAGTQKHQPWRLFFFFDLISFGQNPQLLTK